GEVGRTAIWRNHLSDCYFQKAIHRLRPRDTRISPEFFMYHMIHAFLIRRTYGTPGTVTTIAHLPAAQLKQLRLPLPPREEQDVITRILLRADQKIDMEMRRKQALEVVFASLLHHLMTGKVRVGGLEAALARTEGV